MAASTSSGGEVPPQAQGTSAPEESTGHADAPPPTDVNENETKNANDDGDRDVDDTATDAPGVRFRSAVEEISPAAPIESTPSADAPSSSTENENQDTSAFTAVTEDQLKSLSKSLHGRPLQELRMNTYQFEPFSLPPSRVPSNEDDSAQSRLTTPTSGQFQSPHGSPHLSALASPPLTPAGSSHAALDKVAKDAGPNEPSANEPSANEPPTITPQASTSQERPSPLPERRPAAQRTTSENLVRRASSGDDRQPNHRRTMFALGPGSVPVSRESSPSRSSASNFYSKPMTPGGDLNDPYAKGRRPPPSTQAANRHSIDPRFVFSRKKKHSSPHSSKTSLGGSSDKRASGIFGSIKTSTDDLSQNDTQSVHAGHGSMADLKRFFRKQGHSHHHKKRDSSPASIKPGTQTPPSARSTQQLPFGEDHGLSSKYGKLGKFLGSGAGGSVRLMKRKEDGTVFAVKEFRARHTYETEKEYNKKVTAEFCVGSTLHHGNIIETLDILQEKGRWYEVMEYAPFDLFAIVMTGKMTRPEITCAFLQILNGVTYLHSVGLAHRDLKLDNVVVSDKGIMKIIDFGSAHVFKYPFETDTVPAKGIVGSDPYLAPEVYDSKEYDAVAVDIWSLAIIFCCMTLRRFPWKLPRMTDNSFKLFAAEPTPGHDPKKLIAPSRSTNDLTTTPARDFLPEDQQPEKKREPKPEERKADDHKADGHSSQSSHHPHGSSAAAAGERKEQIRGPWRILRLLPRESRHIVGRMLELDPKTRATMAEILEEPWVADTVICQQLDNGEVISAEDHTHILEPPASAQQTPKNA